MNQGCIFPIMETTAPTCHLYKLLVPYEVMAQQSRLLSLHTHTHTQDHISLHKEIMSGNEYSVQTAHTLLTVQSICRKLIQCSAANAKNDL